MLKFFIRLGLRIAHSTVNILVTLLMTGLFLPLFDLSRWDRVQWELKILCVGVFFAYNLAFELIWGRCGGRMLSGEKNDKKRGPLKKLWFVFLYTLSFSTLLFDVWFPWDLFLVNMIVFQVPCFLIRRKTFHASLADIEIVADDTESTEKKAA